MKKVVLCGYMASGKTSTARLLAKTSGLLHIDLDEVIEQKAGKSIPELFEEGGEIKFRKLEYEVLKTIINGSEGFVLSLGGGTPCYANNHEVFQREDVISVYLKTSIAELVKRIENQSRQRPLINSLKGDELHEFIAQHLFERSYYYHKAKHIVVTDGKSTEQIANEIMSLF